MAPFERNLGVLDATEQARLAACRVAVLGLGGLGGIVAEVLTRSGVGQLVLIDFDSFDASNINRQVFAFTETIGRPKTEVTDEMLRRINPDLETRLAATIDEDNVAEQLGDCDLVVLAADDIVPCIVASRFARRNAIPVVEGWAIPFCNVRVFTPETPTLEECYGFSDLPDPLGELTAERRAELTAQMIFAMKRIDGVMAHYQPDIMERVLSGRIPSFAPMVWFAAVRMALEVTKVLLGHGRPSLAPAFSVYDPYLDRIPTQE